jgi:urease accessory protein
LARSNDIHHCHGCRGALGIAGIGVPFVEMGIALSVVVLGAVVAFNVKARTAAATGIVGLFAIFHGHAHGAEIPPDADGVGYAAGSTIATAMLHLAGFSAGFVIGKAGERYGSVVVRLTGGLATMTGGALLTGIL